MCLQIATESKTHFKTPITSHTCMEAHTCKHGQPTNAHTYTTQHNTTQHNTHAQCHTHKNTWAWTHFQNVFSLLPPPPRQTDLGNVYDFWNVEVGCHRRQSLAYEIGLVGLLPVHLVDVLLRVDGHSANPQFCACPEHSDGNFTCRKKTHR